jgi:mannitol/fructose-specific phosphotransferase system IIA component (Ntr-type)
MSEVTSPPERSTSLPNEAQLYSLLRTETTLPRLGASGQRGAILELVGLFIKVIPTVNPNELVTIFEHRERFCSTATMEGIAFPFAELPGIETPILAIACSKGGVNFGSPKGEATHLFVALVIPAEQPTLTMQLLARLTRLFQSNPDLKNQLILLDEPDEIRVCFAEAESLL